MNDQARLRQLQQEIRGMRLSRRSAVMRASALGLSLAVAAPYLPRSTAAQAKTRIRLGTWAAVEEANQLQEVIDAVNAEAADFEIISEPQPSDYYTKLQTTIAGGTAPDLFWLSQENVAGYAALGALLDVTERLEGDDTPAADLSDYFEPILRTAQYEGQTYGLPWISQPVMLYYNPELLEAAGIEPPDETWDWETFRSAAEQLTDAEAGVYGTSFNGWPPPQMFIWQNGGEVITDDLSECPIDSPEAIEAVQWYADIIYNEQVAVPEAVIAEQGFAEMVKAGKVALFYGGAADTSTTPPPMIPRMPSSGWHWSPAARRGGRRSPGPPRRSSTTRPRTRTWRTRRWLPSRKASTAGRSLPHASRWQTRRRSPPACRRRPSRRRSSSRRWRTCAPST